MRARKIAPQPGRIGQEVDVFAAQPNSLAAAQARPAQHQHEQPVTRRPTSPQQSHGVFVAGAAHPGLGNLQVMASPHPHPPGTVLATGLRRQAAAIGQLVELPHHLLRSLALVDCEGQKAPHGGQYRIDPARTTYLAGSGPGQHHRRARPAVVRGSMAQPQDERPQPVGCCPPIPLHRNAPRQVQGDRTGIALGRRLGIVTAEPHMPQIRVGDPHRSKVVIDHGPVPRARRKSHWKWSQLSTSCVDLGCCNTTAT